MTALQQYGLLAAFIVSTIALVLVLHLLARSFSRSRSESGTEPGKDVPYAGGTLAPKPVWVRYHFRYYGIALLLLAFDMEMAFMYPWSVVFRELGIVSLLDMTVFLSILFLGILYGWSEGALRRK